MKRFLKRTLKFFAKEDIDNVEFNQEYWDDLYRSGRWSYLSDLSELGHYAILVGYVQFFAPQGHYLEIGCGEGILQQRLNVLPYRKYVGVDISETAILKAKAYQDDCTEFWCAPGDDIKFKHKFDIIIFNESLYCFNDCISVLKKYCSLLKEDGVFIVSMHVQAVARNHWQRIDANYNVLDTLYLRNGKDVEWICKAFKPF